MRQRYWNLLTLSGIILSITLGIITQLPPPLIIIGFFFGGSVIFLLHNAWGRDRDYGKETEKLEREGKYRKTVICANCRTVHKFTPSHGVCMLEFLQDKKCTNCKCKLIEQNPIGTTNITTDLQERRSDQN